VKQPDEPWFQLEWKFGRSGGERTWIHAHKNRGTDGEKALAAIDSLAAGGAQGLVICTPDTRLGPASPPGAREQSQTPRRRRSIRRANGKPMTNVHYLASPRAKSARMSARRSPPK